MRESECFSELERERERFNLEKVVVAISVETARTNNVIVQLPKIFHLLQCIDIHNSKGGT